MKSPTFLLWLAMALACMPTERAGAFVLQGSTGEWLAGFFWLALAVGLGYLAGGRPRKKKARSR